MSLEDLGFWEEVRLVWGLGAFGTFFQEGRASPLSNSTFVSLKLVSTVPENKIPSVPKQFHSTNLVERFVVGNGKPLVPKRLRQLLLVQRTAEKRHKTNVRAAK